MQRPRSPLDNFFLFIKGLCMGAANKVPGVSGGIVAYVGGFYEEFIYSLQKLNGKAVTLLFNGRFKSFFRYINAKFLGLLILGMLVSYFSVSLILDYFLKHYEVYVWAWFFGMVVGSIYYVGKDFGPWNRQTVLSGLLGLAIGISISFLRPAAENDDLLFVFFCGIISVSGMTLPGLSGSFILILIGNYVLLLVDSVNALYDTFGEVFSGDFGFVDDPERIRMLQVLAVFTLGSATGLVTFSHLLSYLLKHFKAITTALILGFITGSLGVIWPWKDEVIKVDAAGNPLLDTNGDEIVLNYSRYMPQLADAQTWWAMLYIVLGILLLLILDWYGKKRIQKKPLRPGG